MPRFRKASGAGCGAKGKEREQSADSDLSLCGAAFLLGKRAVEKTPRGEKGMKD